MTELMILLRVNAQNLERDSDALHAARRQFNPDFLRDFGPDFNQDAEVVVPKELLVNLERSVSETIRIYQGIIDGINNQDNRNCSDIVAAWTTRFNDNNEVDDL